MLRLTNQEWDMISQSPKDGLGWSLVVDRLYRLSMILRADESGHAVVISVPMGVPFLKYSPYVILIQMLAM
jgi:hypothetical protein